MGMGIRRCESRSGSSRVRDVRRREERWNRGIHERIPPPEEAEPLWVKTTLARTTYSGAASAPMWKTRGGTNNFTWSWTNCK